MLKHMFYVFLNLVLSHFLYHPDYSNFHGQNCLTPHAADALLLRGLSKVSNNDEDTFTFSRDVRYRVSVM